ncbi:MAG: hypothetical protein HY364_01890 [Candidatus Aenigmarchaeota archaeon]|nr:hypothetical protein [Candidatus Aenigmarchaeota archaeon]
MTADYQSNGTSEIDDLRQVKEIVAKALYNNGRLNEKEHNICIQTGVLSYAGNQFAFDIGKRIIYAPVDLSCGLSLEIKSEFPSIHKRFWHDAQ